MRKLLTALIALASIVFAVGSPASAQGFNGGGFNIGLGPFASSGTTCCVLDGITTGIKAAYSTRQLLTAYAGNAMTVTRSSDSTTSNIGFASNVLNTSALTTFCTGTTCKVTTWYDQSGNGRNVTASAANAPIIYQSGAVNTINGQPSPLFVSANSTLLSAASLSANPVNTLYLNSVVSLSTSTTNAIIGPSLNASLEFRTDSTASSKLELLSAAVSVIATSTTGVSNLTGTIVESQYDSSTGAYSFWVNRSSAGTGTQTSSLTSAGIVQIGASYSSFPDYANGSIGEVIMYDLVGGIPSGSQTTIETNQHTYWGTP